MPVAWKQTSLAAHRLSPHANVPAEGGAIEAPPSASAGPGGWLVPTVTAGPGAGAVSPVGALPVGAGAGFVVGEGLLHASARQARSGARRIQR
jgi:hypothetical protein